MGKIKKLLESELIGGTHNTDVYPVTSTKAVYDTTNKSLEEYIQLINSTYSFKGVALPGMTPDEDGKICYLAVFPGTYEKFNNLVLNEGEATLFIKVPKAPWAKLYLGLITKSYVDNKEVVLSEDEYAALENKKEDVKYYTYEE